MANTIIQMLLIALFTNIFVLVMFWGLGIYRLHLDVSRTLHGGVYDEYCPLRSQWKLVTTFIGILFSPFLIILFILFKAGNYKKGKSGSDLIRNSLSEQDKKEICTKKFFLFYTGRTESRERKIGLIERRRNF